MTVVHMSEGEISSSTSEGRFTTDCSVTPDNFRRTSLWTPSWISLGSKVFIAMIKRGKAGLWHFWIYGSGSDDDIAGFRSSIRIFCSAGGKNRTLIEYGYKGPVVSIFESLADIISQKDGLILSDQALKKIIGENSKFSIEVIVTAKD